MENYVNEIYNLFDLKIELIIYLLLGRNDLNNTRLAFYLFKTYKLESYA